MSPSSVRAWSSPIPHFADLVLQVNDVGKPSNKADFEFMV